MNERFAALGYRVHLTEDDGVWIATARRLDSGDAFGPPIPGDDAGEAAASLAGWLEWQRAHTTALAALQAAESVYHRLAADSFGTVDGDARRAAVREALARVDNLRRQLDDVRGNRPWPH